MPGTARTWTDDQTLESLFVATICHHGRPYPVGETPDPRNWDPGGGIDPMAGLAELLAAARGWFPLAFAPDVPQFPGSPEWIHGWNGVLNLADWLGSSREFFPFDMPGTSAGEVGEVPAGEVPGTWNPPEVGEVPGTSAGEVPGTSAGEVPGTSAGEVPGTWNPPSRMQSSRRQARAVLRWIGLDTGPARAALGSNPPGFAAISDKLTPRPAQTTLATSPLTPAGSITVLEASTGAGKTEAALWHFARLFHAGLVDGMTFALPTRTAATQIETRLVAAAERLFEPVAEGSRPPVVLAVPGYLRVDGVEGHRAPGLPAFQVLWDDDDPTFKRRAWAGEHSKRFLAGGVVAGTVDQVLLSALQTKHAHLRAACLLRHLLVVDEVHASDAYMTRVLEEVLVHHRAAGGHALLMSATLGASARYHLLHPGERRRTFDGPSLAEALAAPYPLISRRSFDHDSVETVPVEVPGTMDSGTMDNTMDGGVVEVPVEVPGTMDNSTMDNTMDGGVVEVPVEVPGTMIGASAQLPVEVPGTMIEASAQLPVEVPGTMIGASAQLPVEVPGTMIGASAQPEKEVTLDIAPLAGDPEAVARLALEAAQAGARVLVVRNTVGDCRAVQRACQDLAAKLDRRDLLFGVETHGQIVPAPHHGRFAPPDRQLLDRAIETTFGPGKHRKPRGWLAVGTQTLEISLDLDADLLLTDLCPMDVLLQRIGRLHRHQLRRPTDFESPRLIVLTPAERDLSTLIFESGKTRGRHGLGGNIYRDLRILEATWRQLEKQPLLRLPTTNRNLVEHSLHPQVLKDLVDTLGGRWAQHDRQIFGQTLGERSVARLGVVDWSRPFGKETFSEERIPTRLGDTDYLVSFADPLPGPFGQPVAQLQIRAYELPDITDAPDTQEPPEPSAIESFPGGFRFQLTGRSFHYDALGLERQTI